MLKLITGNSNQHRHGASVAVVEFNTMGGNLICACRKESYK